LTEEPIMNSDIFFLFQGSAAEVRSMLYLALDLERISKEDFNELYNLTNEISKILTGLIKTMN